MINIEWQLKKNPDLQLKLKGKFISFKDKKFRVYVIGAFYDEPIAIKKSFSKAFKELIK